MKMKKYLMTGIAALALCVGFTSCSHDLESLSQEEINELQAKKIVEKYNQAFIATFGQPAKNQNWGFGPSAGTRTRATLPEKYSNGYSGDCPDANMWTSYGYYAPDPLTQAQKLRAQYYFQMNQIINPNRPNNGTRDFFMQQVYEGGTDPMDGKSLEKYPAANSTADNPSYIESGEHMDHLTAGNGDSRVHMYNFNSGTCSTNDNVANRDQTDVNNTDGKQQHSDQIQLMLNSPTNCFGYANSDASYVRDDRWTLVSAKTIDDFCDADPNFATWLADKLDEGEVDKKCDDDFHRDFIGFDFDMIPDKSCYASQPVKKDGTPVYDLYNESDQIDHYVYYYAHIGDANEANDRYVYNLDGTVTQYDSSNPELIIDGKKVPFITTNTNMFCAIGDKANIGIGGEDGFTDYEKSGSYVANSTNDNTLYLTNVPGINSDLKAINMNFIAKLVRAGYLPIKDKGLKRWVKVGGCNDGYFSDWIVTFMPADSGNTPPTPFVADLRIMAEDLSADEKTDFDFNDIVFDVQFTTASNPARIRVKAAGGTLPLRIKVKDTADHDDDLCTGKEGNGWQEVHALWGKSTGIMINTNATTIVPGKGYEALNGEDDDTIIDLDYEVWDAADAINIIIEVNKGGVWNPMNAEAGAPAAKFATDDTNKRWADEREDLRDHSNFKDWVQGAIDDWDWYDNTND